MARIVALSSLSEARAPTLLAAEQALDTVP